MLRTTTGFECKHLRLARGELMAMLHHNPTHLWMRAVLASWPDPSRGLDSRGCNQSLEASCYWTVMVAMSFPRIWVQRTVPVLASSA